MILEPDTFLKTEKGISLTVVGPVIVSIITLAFLSGLSTNYREKVVQDQASLGEAVAGSQLE